MIELFGGILILVFAGLFIAAAYKAGYVDGKRARR
jgi:hypothetical protein